MISPIFNPLLLISSVLFIHATFIPSVAGQRKENTTTIVDNQSAKVFLTSLPKALEKVRADGGIKGMSVAIVHKGELVFAQGFGKRNRNDPFTKETVTHIASVSKAFTATAIGELVAEGKIDWNETPVSHYLPEFQLKDPVLTSQLTFADLLSHRTPVPTVDTAWYRNARPPRELIKQLRYLDLPSTKLTPFLNYNNVLYGVAGEAAANVAGMSYPDLIMAKLLKPLGLMSAGLSHPEMAKQPNFAMPYEAASFEDAKNGIFEEGYIDEIHMPDAPAGDIFMNVVDLAKWGRVILKEGELNGKQVLNKESVQETLKSQSIDNDDPRRTGFAPTVGYGLGWSLDSFKGHTCFRHGGSNPGYQSHLALFPDDDLVVAHLTNIESTELTSLLPYYIADGMLGLPKSIDWLLVSVQKTKESYAKEVESDDDLPERIENAPYSHYLNDYTGEYTHPVYGEIIITLQKGGKTLHLKYRTLECQLEHYHYESFKGRVRTFGLKGRAFLTFVTGVNRDVQSAKVILPGESDSLTFEKSEPADVASKDK
ncbi:hypothetical protein BGZ97_003882 [Linnemannia gamsii]|uniref:Beta-lactamase/transpeptidase-like protein n=1 Tax=Linnemannia gamsii TaxID=64522 RepID=A0A9P6UTB9_9FUNG|nr:hypothetical protein BGZ97_003882 [Linnemannia gamsii]